jgi:DTW domain-containing protein YfiP
VVPVSPARSRFPRCARCAFRAPCLCPELPSLRPRVEVAIVRHASEIVKQSSSARWAALALGCRVVDYGAEAARFDPSTLPLKGALLLFPASTPSPAPRVLPPLLVVPDGTWQQARHMVLRVPELARLPRLSLPPPPPGPRLRRPHLPDGMSTLEAIAAALSLLGDEEAAAGLRTLHERVNARALAARGWERPE